MSTRLIDFVPGEFYHVYNRGNTKQRIFLDTHDYERFQKVLFLANSSKSFEIARLPKDVFSIERGEQLVNIGAYALMPNHFHILITPAVDDGLSTFMQKLSTGYSKYFNTKHERTGSLFEGKFKAEHASDDVYLKYLFACIHLNPLEIRYSNWRDNGVRDTEEAKAYIQSYKYSSFKDYCGEVRKESVILNREAFPHYFETAEAFEKDVFGWFEDHSPENLHFST